MLALIKTHFQQEVLEAEGFVLVDYWSDGCEPCKALLPDIEALSEAYGDKVKFAKLNTTGARRLAISQKVLGLPTITFTRTAPRWLKSPRKKPLKTVLKK
jgi:thioredoxin 1